MYPNLFLGAALRAALPGVALGLSVRSSFLPLLARDLTGVLWEMTSSSFCRFEVLLVVAVAFLGAGEAPLLWCSW